MTILNANKNMKKLFILLMMSTILSGCGVWGYVEEIEPIENDSTHEYAWVNRGGDVKPIKIKKDKVVPGQEVKYILNHITYIQKK